MISPYLVPGMGASRNADAARKIPAAEVAMKLLLMTVMSPYTYTTNEGRRNRQGQDLSLEILASFQ